MAFATSHPAASPSVADAVPPLEMGDHLRRDEFERRYDAMPDLKKAELIDGVVYLPSRVKHRYGRARALLSTWTGMYFLHTPGLDAAGNATVRFDDLNEPQPDLLLAIESTRGGQSHVDEEDYYAGPPELVADIATSSVSYDLHAKLRLYQREGVREYLVWRTGDDEIDWFRLDDGKYMPISADQAGIVGSTIFPGLWLDRPALLRGDLAGVLSVLQQGIASPEHASFVKALDERRRGSTSPR